MPSWGTNNPVSSATSGFPSGPFYPVPSSGRFPSTSPFTSSSQLPSAGPFSSSGTYVNNAGTSSYLPNLAPGVDSSANPPGRVKQRWQRIIATGKRRDHELVTKKINGKPVQKKFSKKCVECVAKYEPLGQMDMVNWSIKYCKGCKNQPTLCDGCYDEIHDRMRN